MPPVSGAQLLYLSLAFLRSQKSAELSATLDPNRESARCVSFEVLAQSLEELDPEALPSFEETRALLSLELATCVLPQELGYPEARESARSEALDWLAAASEREGFVEVLPPLLLRRRGAASKEYLAALFRRWGAWYGGEEASSYRALCTRFFPADDAPRDPLARALRQLLEGPPGARCFMVREHQELAIVRRSEVSFVCAGETTFSDEEGRFFVHNGHSGAVIVGPRELALQVLRLAPELRSVDYEPRASEEELREC